MNPVDRLADWIEATISCHAQKRDYDAAVRRAEDALVAAEAETEVYEGRPPPLVGAAWNRRYPVCGTPQLRTTQGMGYLCSLDKGHAGPHVAKADGRTLATWQPETMDWHGWAVPAILEVMAEEFPGDWAQRCEEIAPKIADRIACDPRRAIEALTHDTMSR